MMFSELVSDPFKDGLVEDPFGNLHCRTVNRTMLTEQCPAIDADHFVFRKCYPDSLTREMVIGRLSVCRHEYVFVENKIVGVCRG